MGDKSSQETIDKIREIRKQIPLAYNCQSLLVLLNYFSQYMNKTNSTITKADYSRFLIDVSNIITMGFSPYEKTVQQQIAANNMAQLNHEPIDQQIVEWCISNAENNIIDSASKLGDAEVKQFQAVFADMRSCLGDKSNQENVKRFLRQIPRITICQNLLDSLYYFSQRMKNTDSTITVQDYQNLILSACHQMFILKAKKEEEDRYFAPLNLGGFEKFARHMYESSPQNDGPSELIQIVKQPYSEEGEKNAKKLLMQWVCKKTDGNTALMCAVRANNYKYIPLLLEEAGLRDMLRRTALMVAAKYGLDKCVQALAEAESGNQTKDGDTALMFAVRANNYKYIPLLLEEAGLRDMLRRTALMVAAKYGLDKCVQALAEAEAGNQTKEGKSALDFARENGQVECARILEQYKGEK